MPTRPLNRVIVWPRKIHEFEKGGQKFRLRPIDTGDITPLARFFHDFSPYLQGSARQNFFEENFYSQQVCQLSHWNEDSHQKLYFFGVLETLPEQKLIMGFGCQRDPYDLVIQNLNVTLDPSFRGQDISGEYASYMDQLWLECGTDYVYGLISTRHVFSQRIFQKLGGKFGGILPGYFRRSLDGKNYFRDSEVYMYKFYNDAENFFSPIENCQVMPEFFRDVEALLAKMRKA